MRIVLPAHYTFNRFDHNLRSHWLVNTKIQWSMRRPNNDCTLSPYANPLPFTDWFVHVFKRICVANRICSLQQQRSSSSNTPGHKTCRQILTNVRCSQQNVPKSKSSADLLRSHIHQDSACVVGHVWQRLRWWRWYEMLNTHTQRSAHRKTHTCQSDDRTARARIARNI